MDAGVVGDTQTIRFAPGMGRELRYETYPPVSCNLYHELIYHEQIMNPPEYIAVDCHPSAHHMSPTESEIREIETTGSRATYFRQSHFDAKQIFLEKASMAEILDVALSKQEPEQERIRKEMVKRQELQNMGNYKAANVAAELRLISA